MDQVIQQLVEYLRGTWRRRWIGLGVAWFVAIVGAVVLFKTPNKYEASARVYVDTQSMLKPLMSPPPPMPMPASMRPFMSPPPPMPMPATPRPVNRPSTPKPNTPSPIPFKSLTPVVGRPSARPFTRPAPAS